MELHRSYNIFCHFDLELRIFAQKDMQINDILFKVL